MKSLGLEAPPLERRLAAILAADVEGYSRLMHGDEEATLATLSAQRATVDALIMRHKGRIATTAGDSVLAELQVCLARFIARSRSRRRWREQTRGRSRRTANALSNRQQCR
jgi:adenylate cyclase